VIDQFVDVTRDAGGLALQVILDRAGEGGMRQPVRRVRLHRQQSAKQLVLALRAAFEQRQPVRNGVFDRLVVAAFEVQQRNVLRRAPVPAPDFFF